MHTDAIQMEARCWSCGHAVGGHFCGGCGKIQPAGADDYFEFFGLPRKLNIDTAALEREFYRLSRKLHPDVFAIAGAREQQWSTEKTSQLNDAYRALKDPIARTQCLLALEGVKLEEQSRSATDAARHSGGEKKQVVPPDMLEEVFELNMQLDEMRMNKQMGEDDPNVIRDLQQARERFEQKMNGLTAELKGYWDEWDALVPEGAKEARERVRDRMVDLLNRRSYIRNLLRDVNEVLGS
ncbi:MAG TPA: Fe-S protein assembly co-chaperone HscB [Candidatus Saccharimonadales bacterium]|jgi:molecular chaperone HscB|nr:Fe-S protein assembly co-chaperone HscB [Candidatus Saccharimonadales bacterium]